MGCSGRDRPVMGPAPPAPGGACGRGRLRRGCAAAPRAAAGSRRATGALGPPASPASASGGGGRAGSAGAAGAASSRAGFGSAPVGEDRRRAGRRWRRCRRPRTLQLDVDAVARRQHGGHEVTQVLEAPRSAARRRPAAGWPGRCPRASCPGRGRRPPASSLAGRPSPDLHQLVRRRVSQPVLYQLGQQVGQVGRGPAPIIAGSSVRTTTRW